jgi:NADP-reducing hydrogenase subunit HndB
MTLIRSMEDLAQAKAEALEQQHADARRYRYHIRVSMGSCGIAAGARDTWNAINDLVASQGLDGIHVSQIGCLGLCALEPVVQVQRGDHPAVTYGRVTPDVAKRILQEHIGKGLIVEQYTIESV